MELSNDEKADLRFLRVRYGWNDSDAREVMESIVESRSGASYYRVLAAAHRAGYAQTSENGFIRLQTWCAEQGLGDPFAPGFELATLQAPAIVQAEAA